MSLSLSLPLPSPPDLPNGSPNYQNATALIISFIVNNHLDDTQNQLAKIWEKAFIDYLKETSNLTSFTNVTYMSEVSIFSAVYMLSKPSVVL